MTSQAANSNAIGQLTNIGATDANKVNFAHERMDHLRKHGGGNTTEDVRQTTIAEHVMPCCKNGNQTGGGLTDEQLAMHMSKLQEAAKRESADIGTTSTEPESAEDVSTDDTGSETENSDTSSMDTSDSEDTETDSDEENGKTMDDESLKEVMGDIMYICCQRPAKRRLMLMKMNRKTVKDICDCCNAILTGDVPIKGEEKEKLIPHREILRALQDSSMSTGEKKDIMIVQSGGGFLLSLVPIVIGALVSLFQ